MMDEKNTCDLMSELNEMQNLDAEFDSYLKRRSDAASTASLFEYLNDHFTKQKRTLSEVIKASGIAPSYAYNIFSGKKSHPDKYKLIPLCIALGMSLQEINRALFLAVQPALSPKSDRDAAIIVCLKHQICDVQGINEFLFLHHLETL